MQRIAAAYGARAHIVVTYESLVVTMSRGEQFRTKAGLHIPAPNVNMGAMAAGLAAVGYGVLFNVPWRLTWVGVICGMAGHSLRTAAMGWGFDIIVGSLFGALAAGLIAHFFANRFRAPFAAFAFPGVVAMIPGAFAFRAMMGLLEVIKLGQNAPLPLVTETLTLAATVVLMVVAIGVGVAVPSLGSRPKW